MEKKWKEGERKRGVWERRGGRGDEKMGMGGE